MVVRGPSDGAQVITDIFSTGTFSPVGRTAVVGVERTLARPTNRLVAVGDRVRSDLLAAGIGRPDKFVVVPPGTQLGALPSRSAARIGLGLRPDSVVVTLVARLTPIKRPERFVQLAPRAREGPSRRGVRRRRRWRAPSSRCRILATRLRVPIRFLGWRSDVETVYSASDVVVLTSDNEGMPVSSDRSYGSRVDPVSLRMWEAPARWWASGTTGIVTTTDVDALATAVAQLLNDEELRRTMGTAAVGRAQRLSRCRTTGEMTHADIYEELAGRSSIKTAS